MRWPIAIAVAHVPTMELKLAELHKICSLVGKKKKIALILASAGELSSVVDFTLYQFEFGFFGEKQYLSILRIFATVSKCHAICTILVLSKYTRTIPKNDLNLKKNRICDCTPEMLRNQHFATKWQ